MPIFDPSEQRLCVRVVYDGVGGAGKTTNLKALSQLFAAQRSTELVSPGELDGRTLYFDWLQIMAGSIGGFPVMCQIISVPGQAALTPRRRHLLGSADVVVFVCDSDPAGIERARRGVELLAEVVPDVPMIVQANKQDQPRALPGGEVVALLGADAPFTEAIATDGIGVVDTFVQAVRAISRRVQAQCEAGACAVPVAHAPAATDVLARLEAQRLDPEWAAEMFLEEAAAAFLVDGGFDRTSTPERRHAAPAFPRPDVEPGFVWPAHTGRPLLGELAAEEPAEPTASRDGTYDAVVGGRRLRTSAAHRFTDREEARQALVRAAREESQRDESQVGDTTLVLQAARDGAFWLWTITPAVTPRREAPARAVERAAPSPG